MAHFHYPLLYGELNINVLNSSPSWKIIVSTYLQALVLVAKTGLLQPSLHGEVDTGNYKEIMAGELPLILGP